MKRYFKVGTIVIAFILLFVIIAAWPYVVIFSGKCTIGALGLSLKVPGHCYIVTRSSDRIGIGPDLYKLLKDETIDNEFKERDVYLSARYRDYEINIEAFQDFGTSFLMDLNRLSEVQLRDMVLAFSESHQGGVVSLYETKESKYILIDYPEKKIGDSYTIQAYVTIKNGKLINVSLLSKEGKFGKEGQVKLKEMVDSISYIKNQY